MKNVRPPFAAVSWLGVCLGLAGFVSFGLLSHAAARAGSEASKRAEGCKSNMKNIGIAFAIYTTDYDDRFPCFSHVSDRSRVSRKPLGGRDLTQWIMVVQPYSPGMRVFYCPTHQVMEKKSQYQTLRANSAYMLNRAVEGLEVFNISDPDQKDLLFETAVPGKKLWFEPPRDLIWGSNRVLGVGKHEAGVFSIRVDTSFHVIPPKLLEKDPCGLPWSGVDLMRKYPIPKVKGRPSLFTKKCPK